MKATSQALIVEVCIAGILLAGRERPRHLGEALSVRSRRTRKVFPDGDTLRGGVD